MPAERHLRDGLVLPNADVKFVGHIEDVLELIVPCNLWCRFHCVCRVL